MSVTGLQHKKSIHKTAKKIRVQKANRYKDFWSARDSGSPEIYSRKHKHKNTGGYLDD